MDALSLVVAAVVIILIAMVLAFFGLLFVCVSVGILVKDMWQRRIKITQ